MTPDPAPDREPSPIEVDAVSAWLDDHLAPTDQTARGPWAFDLIAAGGSNLTYRVSNDAGMVVALRRPPVGRALATAHDVDREWRIITALHRSGAVPVPAALARCDDVDVTGAPFYVMSFVDGHILRARADAVALGSEAAHRATDALIGAQVAMHTLDLEQVGLADLGRHEGYVTRQLKRWMTQVRAAVERGGIREVPLITELHDELSARVPPERARPALAHGDYRFDNVVLTPELAMAAVLDWELCTTGDPIADFAWSLQYWADPDDRGMTWLPDPPTTAPGFPRRAEVLDRYRVATGFDLTDFAFYEAFSWWKQACIVEGVHARRLAGVRAGMADTGPPTAIAERVDAMLEHAASLVDALH